MTTHGLDDAIEDLRRELGDVRAMSDCPTCECFLGVVAQAAADLKRADSPVAVRVRGEFETWLLEARSRLTTCRQCEVCVPAGPYGRFRETLAATSPAGPAAVDTGADDWRGDDPGTDVHCGCQPQCRD